VIWGSAVTVTCFGVMGVASAAVWPLVYVVFLFFGQLALNVVYSAQCGLPADLQGIGPDGNHLLVARRMALCRAPWPCIPSSVRWLPWASLSARGVGQYSTNILFS